MNKYLYDDGAIIIFHDDDLRVLKEIRSFLENNEYEMHSRWVGINTLSCMSSKAKGKKVKFLPFLTISIVALFSTFSFFFALVAHRTI